MRIDDNQIIYELFKISSVILPEKNDWSLDDVLNRLSTTLESTNRAELGERIRKVLKDLEQKQAVIFVNGYDAFNLVEPKLAELTKV